MNRRADWSELAASLSWRPWTSADAYALTAGALVGVGGVVVWLGIRALRPKSARRVASDATHPEERRG